jgi:Arc/MetJ-type ribon-helix-helix transcriptional regulator
MYDSYIMRRTQIYLDDEQHQRLSERARQTGRSMSELIRNAVDRDLDGDGDEETKLQRFRETVRAVAGCAPYLEDGATYVARLREADRERMEELERRWRG